MIGNKKFAKCTKKCFGIAFISGDPHGAGFVLKRFEDCAWSLPLAVYNMRTLPRVMGLYYVIDGKVLNDLSQNKGARMSEGGFEFVDGHDMRHISWLQVTNFVSVFP